MYIGRLAAKRWENSALAHQLSYHDDHDDDHDVEDKDEDEDKEKDEDITCFLRQFVSSNGVEP